MAKKVTSSRSSSRSALPTPPKGVALVGQSGGPTAVINQSLVGVVEGCRAIPAVTKILGMRNGVSGLVKQDVVDLGKLSPSALNAIARSPSAALGSSRDKPDAEYCARILEACKALKARYYFYIGGNDSSDTCRIVSELAQQSDYDMRCFHVPKTVDNDLMGNDHTPGFPSAARYVATAFAADSLDNASLPGVKINVVMGRHAGFLTAASALARECVKVGKNGKYVPGPHLIYVPEVAFDTQKFVEDVQRVYDEYGRCQIAVSEGIQDAEGGSIGATLTPSGEVDPHGNVQLSGTGALGDALSELVKKNVKRADGKAVRVRADTFGYLQRCWPDMSPVDAKEARQAGKFAAALAKKGELNGSVAIRRAKGKAYKAEYARQELTDVAAKTRHLPEEFLKGASDVSPAFMAYIRPLVGKLPELAAL